ncbi:MAG TPA: glycosyltransferase 87 family protein [Gaiellaceae bacterium]|nr:glycosyltransferase 87 family protein [Gaiellaceae bacterium]
MRFAALAVAAACVFLGSWTLLHHLWYASPEIVDTPEYQSYAHRIVDGKVPYRDFSVEYPPGALLPMLAPDATAVPGDFGSYGHTFEKWIAGAGIVMVLLFAFALGGLEPTLPRALAALLLVAVSPLLLGNLMLSRFDLWVAALTVGAVGALTREKRVTSALVLGAAIATKLYPAVIVPIGIAWIWRRWGRNAALGWLAIVTAVVAAAYAPFFVLSPGGVWHSVSTQLSRPLQIESLAAAVLVAVHNGFGSDLHVYTTVSQNLSGSGVRAGEVVSSVLQIGVLLALWFAFARGAQTRDRLVAYSAATVVAFVAFGKVLSPQYMVWLIPLVPLVRNRLAQAFLVLSLVLTQVEFPKRYWQYATNLSSGVGAVVLARDLVLVALLVLLVWQPGRERVDEDALLGPGQPA